MSVFWWVGTVDHGSHGWEAPAGSVTLGLLVIAWRNCDLGSR